jgi:DNA-binding FadR family transcriptional regulator
LQLVRWLEDEIQLGRLKVGDSFPSERGLSQRLKVSRSAVREAKALLCGRGLLVQERLRARFVQRDAATLFREWVASVRAHHETDHLRPVREVLELRRLVLPETTALAVRRASPLRLKEVIEAYSTWQLTVAARGSEREVAQRHDEVVLCCADVAASPPLMAMSVGLVEAAKSLQLFQSIHDHRTAWNLAIKEVLTAISARKASVVRSSLRRQLGTLDRTFCEALRARRVEAQPGLEFGFAS